jgi:hypothetical protein
MLEAITHMRPDQQAVYQQWAGSPNKSPEPTAVGAFSSAVAVHVTSRRWLSFLRSYQ